MAEGVLSAKGFERTPVVMVTGFLGSGKTTYLNRALRSPLLSTAAVVINEFGTIPIDHLLSEASDDQIVVLENGCLCCTVFGDLLSTLDRLYHQREAGSVPPFDRVIIETSGLADPRPIVQAFLSDPSLEGLYRLDSVVTLFDAVNGPQTLDRHDQSIHQLALADVVLISKLDLLGLERASELEARARKRIRGCNPAADIHSTTDAGVDPVAVLLKSAHSLSPHGDAQRWLNAAAYLKAAETQEDNGAPESHVELGHLHASAHRGPAISSFCLVRDEPISRYGLELLLTAIERNLGPALLRLKGLVHVQETPERPAVIQGAQHLLHNLQWLDEWPSEDHSTRVVFITAGIDHDELAEMVSLLDRVAQRTAKAKERAAVHGQAGALNVGGSP
jgi:G3E family GTPase